MRFDPDRFEVLAGVRSHTDYRYKKLQEMETKIVLSPENEEEQAMVDQLVSDIPADEVEVETLPGMAAGASAGDASPEAAAPDVPGPEEVVADDMSAASVDPEMEEPLEERLRRIIRTEVRQIVSEEISKRDDRQVARAQKSKSVADAMGFSSSTVKRSTPKRWSPTLGFTGPGFK